MATQQAWDDFNALKAHESFIEGELTNCLKDAVTKLELLATEVAGDPVRLAAVSALADQHPTWTAARIMDLYGRMLAVKAAVIAQGF